MESVIIGAVLPLLLRIGKKSMLRRELVCSGVVLFSLWTVVALADDWATFQGTVTRNAWTNDDVDVQQLGVAWQWDSPYPPQPAWEDLPSGTLTPAFEDCRRCAITIPFFTQ